MKNYLEMILYGTFILFVHSGLLKWLDLGADITLITSIPIIIVTLYNILSSRIDSSIYKSPTFWLLLFSLFAALSYTYTASNGYWFIKLRGIFLSLMGYCFPVFVLTKQIDFQRFIKAASYMYISGILFLLGVFINNGSLEFLFWSVKELEANRFPDYLAVGTVLVVAILFVYYSSSGITRIWSFIGLFLLAMTGARGPIIFFAVAVTLNVLLSLSAWRSSWLATTRSIIFALSLVWGGVYALLYTELGENSIMRFQSIESELDIDKENSRQYMYQQGLSVFDKNRLIGVGIGGYGAYTIGEDIRAYPHNLFIEILAEYGGVGMLIFLPFFILLIRRSIIRDGSSAYRTIYSCALVLFLCAMKSDGLEDGRILFSYLGLLYAYAEIYERGKSSSKNLSDTAIIVSAKPMAMNNTLLHR